MYDNVRVLVKAGIAAAALALLFAIRGDVEAPKAAPALRVAEATDKPSPTKQKRDADAESDGACAILIGDGALRGAVDLASAVESDGRYQVEIGDGRRATLTLEPALQAAAEKVLDRAKARFGAVVVMAPDGRILALAGRTESGDADFDLPFDVWAPAASVFKVVTASALLGEGVDPDAEVCYHGGIRSVDASHLRDDPKRDKQCGDLEFAVAKSQNAIIGKLANKYLDAGELSEVAEAFGFGKAPKFAVEVEPNRAEIPDDDLERARVAAGFWHTELSPLGGALVANTIASGGLEVTPRIVASVIDEDGTETAVVGEAPRRVLDKDVASQVAELMVATTEYGTAKPAFRDRRGRKFLSDVKVAGKTGSLSKQKPEYVGYSWFVGFAPADEPQVTIAVVLGNPPRWHLKAHTAARLVLQQVF